MIEWEVRVEPGGASCQDRAAVLEVGQVHLAVVADAAGEMGGARGATEAVVRGLERLHPSHREAGEPDYWCSALREIDRQIAADPAAGETTAVVVACAGQALVGASVGDSEAHLYTADSFTDLTRGQRRRPYLGSGAAHPVAFGPHAFAGTLVVASDGLFKYATAQEIWDAGRGARLSDVAETLAALPRLASGGRPDDLAVVVVRPR